MFTAGRVRVLALALADVVCLAFLWSLVVCGYWGLGWTLKNFGIPTPIGGYVPSVYCSFWPMLPAFLAINVFFGLYHGNWMYPSVPHSPVEEFRRLFDSAAILHVGAIAFLALRFQTTDGYSRVVISMSGLMTAFLAQSFRNWMRIALMKLKVAQIPVLMTGGGAVALQAVSVLKNNPYWGLKVVGYFEGARHLGRAKRRKAWNDRQMADLGVKYLGSLRDAVAEARRRDIKILIACQDPRLFRQQMDEFSSWFTFIEYVPTARTFPIFGSRGISIDGVGGLEMVNQGRMKAKRVQKRIMDTVLAGLAFAVLSPLFVILPILIKLTSRGPVFYRQERLGRTGKPFRVWKFRSMHANAEARLRKVLAKDQSAAAEWSRNFKLAHDPRITLLGRFLRKTSLDELPQLLNVFAGDMALIGPRPIVAEEKKYYGDAYGVFSSVRPGVTGLWQVSGRSDTDYARRVALDTSYVLNWSPWMDVWILVRTVYAVLLMRGAR